MGESGSVAWMFDKKGLIIVDKGQIDEDRLIALVLDGGAEDVLEEDDLFEIVTPPQDFEKVRELLQRENVAMVTAQVSMMPKSTVTLDKNFAEQALNLTSDLEDHDDVQSVAANYDIPDEIIEKAS